MSVLEKLQMFAAQVVRAAMDSSDSILLKMAEGAIHAVNEFRNGGMTADKAMERLDALADEASIRADLVKMRLASVEALDKKFDDGGEGK